MSVRKPLTGPLQEPIWELQPGETKFEYKAFCFYRDCGLDRRSQRAVCIGMGRNTTSFLSQISSISRANRWVERVQAWDAFVAAKEAEEAARETLERHRARRQERTKYAQAMQNAGVAILMASRLFPTVNPDGTVTPPNPDEKLSAEEARKLLRAAGDLVNIGMTAERLEEGLATQIHMMVSQELEGMLEHLRSVLTTEEYEKVYRALASRYGAGPGAAG